MVFTVRCFKCGQDSVRLVLGGRSILHAKCHNCNSNLLSEILELEEETRHSKPVHRPQKEELTREVFAEEETELMNSSAE